MASPRRPCPLLLALAGVAVLSGCTATNPITTMDDYSPSDGVRGRLGTVSLGNIMVLTAEEGAPGTVLGSVTNDGEEEISVSLGLVDGEPVTVDVPGGDTVLLGPDQDEEIELESVPAEPGGLVDMLVSADREGEATLRVPVLDGTLPEYAELVPDAEG